MTIASNRTSAGLIDGARLAARASNQSWPGLAGFCPRSPARSAERLCQPVEGRYPWPASARVPVPSTSRMHRCRERLVEAHVQRPPALPREPARLLDRNEALAAACGPDDLDPALAARVETCCWAVDAWTSRSRRSSTSLSDQPAQLDGRRQELVDDRELGGRQRVSALPSATPPLTEHAELLCIYSFSVLLGSEARRHRRSPSRTGIPPRAPPVPIAIDRTDHRNGPQDRKQTGVDGVFVSHALALRHPVGTRLPAAGRRRARRAHAEAIDLVAKKRDEHGRWPLENPHPGPVHFEMEGRAGEPSRWNTLRALRVLRWASAS